MPKITVIDMVDIGTQLAGMSHEQLAEFYKKFIDPLEADDFATDIINGNKTIPNEEIPELLAINLSVVPGIYFVRAPKTGTSVFLNRGMDSNNRPIYNQTIMFSSIGYKNKYTPYDGTSNLPTFINFVNYYNKNYLPIEMSLYNAGIADLLTTDTFGGDADADADTKVLKVVPVKTDDPWTKICKTLKLDCMSQINLINIIIKITGSQDIFSLNKTNYTEIIDNIAEYMRKKLEFADIVAKQIHAEYKNEYLEAVVKRKFKNKTFKQLTSKEQSYIESYISIKEELFKSVENNKCRHVQIINKLNKSVTLAEQKQMLYKLKEFMPKTAYDKNAKPGLIKCTVCARALICQHTVELVGTMSYTTSEYKINQLMSKYVDELHTGNGYFCKICGEHLYDAQSLALSSGMGSGKPMETTHIEEIIWREVRTALNHVRFNVSKKGAGVFRIDPQHFIKDAIAILTPWLEIIKKKENKAATTTEDEVNSFLNIYGAAYANVLIAVISFNNYLIEVIEPKLGKRASLNIDIISNHVMNIKAVDIRSLRGRVTLDLLKTKIAAAYTIMNDLYQKTDNLNDNLVDLFKNSVLLGPIISHLKFASTPADILLSKNDNMCSSIIIPSGPPTLRFYAENLKNGIWPGDVEKLHKIIKDNEKNIPRVMKYLQVSNDIVKYVYMPTTLNLNRYYDTQGFKYDWDIYVFKDGEYTAKQCLDLENNVAVIDMKTTDGVLLSNVIKNTGNDKIIEMIAYRNEIIAFYDRVQIYCPVLLGEHDYVENKCTKCGFEMAESANGTSFEDYYKKYKKAAVTDKNDDVNTAADFLKEIKMPDFKSNLLVIKEFADVVKIPYKEFEKLIETGIKSRDDTTIANIIYLIQEVTPTAYDLAIDGKMTLPLNEIMQFLIQTMAETALKLKDIEIGGKVKQFFEMLKNFIRPDLFTRWDLLSRTTIRVMSKETQEDKVPEVNEFDISPEDADVEGVEVPFSNEFDLDTDVDNSDQ